MNKLVNRFVIVTFPIIIISMIALIIGPHIDQNMDRNKGENIITTNLEEPITFTGSSAVIHSVTIKSIKYEPVSIKAFLRWFATTTLVFLMSVIIAMMGIKFFKIIEFAFFK